MSELVMGKRMPQVCPKHNVCMCSLGEENWSRDETQVGEAWGRRVGRLDADTVEIWMPELMRLRPKIVSRCG